MNSLTTLNHNILSAVDVETTGRDPSYHEVCQLAIVTLDENLEPGPHFYTNICPEFPNRIHPQALETHGLTYSDLEGSPSKEQVIDSLWDWFQELNLLPMKRLIPLCHNSQFDIPFLQAMLGHDFYNDVFGYPTRDTQGAVVSLMDRAAWNGTVIPFSYANLKTCCETLGVQLDDAHDALADALATAEIYKKILERRIW